MHLWSCFSEALLCDRPTMQKGCDGRSMSSTLFRDNSHLEVEFFLSNQRVGFLQRGFTLKAHGFPEKAFHTFGSSYFHEVLQEKRSDAHDANGFACLVWFWKHQVWKARHAATLFHLFDSFKARMKKNFKQFSGSWKNSVVFCTKKQRLHGLCQREFF